jgi:hypothetical protein
MGGALADQFSDFQTRQIRQEDSYHFRNQRSFASVFGTPLAGALFALEVLYFSKISYKSMVFILFGRIYRLLYG